jgi:hypothetical protein
VINLIVLLAFAAILLLMLIRARRKGMVIDTQTLVLGLLLGLFLLLLGGVLKL